MSAFVFKLAVKNIKMKMNGTVICLLFYMQVELVCRIKG